MKKQVKAHRTLVSTSRHEAAHAVIAVLLGCRVRRLELKSVDGSMLGGAELDGRAFRVAGPFSVGMMLMAGSVADNVWGTERVGIVSGDDHAALKHMGATSKDMRALYLAVRPMVEKNRANIERVARALRKRGKLQGPALQKLLKRRRDK